MKIVNIKGGLGNQMFQYAFALALGKKNPKERIMIDTQLYHNSFVKEFRGNNFYHNGFEIKRLFSDANLPIATWKDIIRVSYYIPNYVFSRAARKFFPKRKREYLQALTDAYVYDRDVLESNMFSYFDGYWNSLQYFDEYKNDVVDAFKFPPFDTEENIEFANKLGKENSVTIHVRRGDYLNIPVYQGLCNLDYYKKAISEVKGKIKDPVFFVFSNDQEWCRENLKELLEGYEVIYVTNNKGNDSYRDMQLMTLARCNILANSSFSWWGAYLNIRKDNIAIVPEKWVNMPCDKLYPNNWIIV